MTKAKQAGPLESLLGWKVMEAISSYDQLGGEQNSSLQHDMDLAKHIARHLAKNLTMADLQAAGMIRPQVMRTRRSPNSVDLLRQMTPTVPKALQHQNPDEQD